MSHSPLLIIAALLYTLGLLSLALFWRTMGHHYLFFGLFALAHGLWLFSRMLYGRYTVDWVALDFLNAFIRYTVAVPIWLLLMRFLGDGWRSSMRWGLWAFVVFAPAGILWDLVHWQPYSAMRVYNVLVPLGVAVALGNLFRTGWKGSREVWMVRTMAIGRADSDDIDLQGSLCFLGELLVLVAETAVCGCGYDWLAGVYRGEEILGSIRCEPGGL
jgi:hypothetical protein